MKQFEIQQPVKQSASDEEAGLVPVFSFQFYRFEIALGSKLPKISPA
jgi:hypothetical protein